MKNIPLIYQWHVDPFTLLAIVGLLCFYIAATDFQSSKKLIFGCLAFILMVLSSFSPLHFLGMHYYFSVHMVAHIILLLLSGPLLVLSLQPKQSSFLYRRLQALSAFISKHCVAAWLSGVSIMWFWHIPAVFDYMLSQHMHHSVISVLHFCSMVIAGMLFSWPLFGPFKKFHIHPLQGIVYLFTACISCSLLGLLITFAPLSTYHYYTGLTGMQMVPGGPLGISQAADQQAAGLIMWVPCCFVYLAGCLYLLQTWFSAAAAPTLTPETNI